MCGDCQSPLIGIKGAMGKRGHILGSVVSISVFWFVGIRLDHKPFIQGGVPCWNQVRIAGRW